MQMRSVESFIGLSSTYKNILQHHNMTKIPELKTH